MGATYVPDLMPCAHKIMYAVIDTLTRQRAELGLRSAHLNTEAD
jgi:hypothetical protein